MIPFSIIFLIRCCLEDITLRTADFFFYITPVYVFKNDSIYQVENLEVLLSVNRLLFSISTNCDYLMHVHAISSKCLSFPLNN